MIDTTAPVTNPVLAIAEFDVEFLPAALAVVEKFNRRAARAGIADQFTVAHSTSFVVDPQADVLGLEAAGHDVVTFVVLGKPLVVDGWEFVATLSFDEEAGVITRPVPGATEVSLDAFRGQKVPTCDLCKTARRRTDTYVLLGADGTLQAVGRNCLAAFIGLDVTGALSYIGEDIARKIESEVGFTGGGAWRFPAQTVIALASASIAAFGWVSKSSFDGRPTVARVESVLYPLPTSKGPREAAIADREGIAAKLSEVGVTPAQARADEVLAWVRAGGVGTSEYAQNLQAILSADTVGARNLGLAVSAVSAWARAQDKALEQAARAQRAVTSGFVGKEKERLQLSLELVQQPRFIDGDFGVKTLLIFADEAGNVFKWWATGSHDYAVGSKWVGKATVKKHEEYNGAKSTVLTRCKLEAV